MKKSLYWYTVTRPGTLSISLTPVLVGTSLAWAETTHFSWPAALASLMATLLLQIGTNLVNTAPGNPLAYSSNCELFAFLIFGLLAVMGSYYLQTHDLSLNSLCAAWTIGLQAAAIRLIDNYQDQGYGRAANRFSLVSYLGQRQAQTLYSTLLLLSFLALLPIVFFRPVAGIALVTLSPAIRMIRFFSEAQAGPGFNCILTGTATLQLIFGLALSIGLLFG
jgi:1,4-dihydroxy-2-naphthoate octaprenyltransferase